MKRQKFDAAHLGLKARKLVPRLLVAGSIILLAAFLFIQLSKAVKNLDYFKIKDIIIKGNERVDLSYLEGQGVFSVDIRKESAYIAELYPNFKLIRIIRILPNRLYVDFLRRQPIAMVKLYRYFCVDEEAVLFDYPMRLEELDLPQIWGLETKIFGPKIGRIYNLKELRLALRIIQEVKRDRVFKDYQLKRIDVQSLANTAFFLSATPKTASNAGGTSRGEIEIIEVKIGQEEIKERIALLASLLGRGKDGFKNIKYIDLRFKEPVIKLNDVKAK